jgi:hypothetical protein
LYLKLCATSLSGLVLTFGRFRLGFGFFGGFGLGFGLFAAAGVVFCFLRGAFLGGSLGDDHGFVPIVADQRLEGSLARERGKERVRARERARERQRERGRDREGKEGAAQRSTERRRRENATHRALVRQLLVL